MLRSRTNRLAKSIVFMLFGILVLGAASWPESASAMRHGRWRVGLEIELGDYDYLSEYGEWVEYPDFGMVWIPYVVASWSPFFHGHWSWTYDGWAWMSYEPFGWLVYHYGYWYHRPRIGWFWVPGRIWSPARVQWFTYGDYCAWAPMPPPRHRWRDPWDYDDFNVWIVINFNNFADDYVGHHRIRHPFRGDRIRHGAWSRQAPSVKHVERITRREIPPVRISKERVERRVVEQRTPTRYHRPKEIERKRMVVPDREAARVRQHSEKVEREVLVPRERAPRREIQRAPEKRSEKKTSDTQRKTIKRR